MNSNSYQKILRLAGRYPNGPKKILKNAYGVYKEGWSTYQYFRYNNRYEYPIIYIAAGNRSGSTWLRNVLAFLLDGFIVYHPKNHPRADKGGNYDINQELIKEIRNKLFVIRSHTPPKPSNIEMMNESFRKYVVIVRDVRDVIVSLAYQLKKNSKSSAFINYGLSRKLPWDTILVEELKLPIEEFIDLLIDRLLPGILSITQGWVKYAEGKDNVKVLRFEDLVRDPVLHIRDILAFYDLAQYDAQIKKAVDVSFNNIPKIENRKWQDHLSAYQQEECMKKSSVFLKKMGYLD